MNARSICEDCPAKTRAACERKEGHFDVAIVLDFPTQIEARRGKLLAGDTGRLIKTIMQGCGLHEDQVYVTSALNCYPSEKKETILRKYMESCRPRLVQELQDVGVKKVLCLGPIGYSALMSLPKVARSTKVHGRWKRAWDMNIMCTMAPTIAFADPGWYRDIVWDIDKFCNTDGRGPYPQLTVWTPETFWEVKWAFDWLEKQPFLSCDFETTGFSPIDNYPICVGYSCYHEDEPNIGYAIVIDLLKFDELWVWRQMLKQLASDQPTVFHNAKFDLKFMQQGAREWKLDYDPWEIHDTMLLNYLVDERVGKYEPHNLEGLARKWYDAPDYGINTGKWLKQWEKEEDDEKRQAMERELHQYCGMDCYYTARLLPDLLAEARLEDTISVYYKLMRPASIALADVELVGIRLDTDTLHAIKEEEREYAEEVLERIRSYVGEFDADAAAEFNPNSPKQMEHFMYQVLKLPPTKTPRRGKLQEGPTSAAVIRILRDKFPEHEGFFADVLAYRTATKTVGTFVDGLIKRMDSDGRIRTDLLLNGTETGRLSSRNPNLQNIPEVSHIEIDIRACFVATNDEWVLIEADYSQLELRVAAHLSEDEDWLQVYLEGRDLHQDVAGALYHKPREQVTPYQRWLAKNTVFGAMYGRGAESLALGPEMDYIEKVYGGTRWTLDEAKQYFENFFNRYKGFKTWIDNQHRIAYTQHYVVSAFGRKRRFPFISRNDNGLVKRQSVNTPIQSTASDITLSALLRIHDRLLELNYNRGEEVARVVLTIHDSVMVEARKKVKRTVMKIMEEEMQERVPLDSRVPFKADVHVAENWSGLK